LKNGQTDEAYEPTDTERQKLARVDATKVFFPDLHGRLKSVTVNPLDLPSLFKRGTGIDGSSVPGLATVDDSDMVLIPIRESLRFLEFPKKKIAFFLGRLHDQDGKRSSLDARGVLERVVERAEKEHGVRFLVGPEHEFFLLENDEFSDDDEVHTDKAGYFSTSPGDAGEPIRQQIAEILTASGIRYEKMHHEVTRSQQEINLECGPPLEVADRTLLFTHVTKEVAFENDLHATFMSKPFDRLNRNAFHIHLSMQDLEGNNLFHDASDEDAGLSQKARWFIGGILKHARETSIVMAATLNSYKAYILDREAPVLRSWGVNNRSSMVRVPIAMTPDATRIELRSPDATGNVYLQFATYIAMGLAGIEGQVNCREPDVGSTYDVASQRKERVCDQRYLPRDIFEALMEAERGNFLRELVQPDLYNNYMALKTEDWQYHRARVTDRERTRYLGI